MKSLKARQAEREDRKEREERISKRASMANREDSGITGEVKPAEADLTKGDREVIDGGGETVPDATTGETKPAGKKAANWTPNA